MTADFVKRNVHAALLFLSRPGDLPFGILSSLAPDCFALSRLARIHPHLFFLPRDAA